MTTYEKIAKDRLTEGADRGTLALLMGEICVDGKPMPEEDAIKRLSQMRKVCEKNIKLYDEANRDDMFVKEAYFEEIILSYLPKGATQEDIESALATLNLPRTMKSMGLLMKELKSDFAVVDGNLVKSILIGG